MSEKCVYHNVYFQLKDSSDEAIEKLIAECHTYLKPVPGIIYFSVGRLLEEHNREVNVLDFHVGTHVTFLNKAAHDAYQTNDLHNKFVERNIDNWGNVRVFDMYADYSG